MLKRIKLIFFPSKENNFRSHLLSIKALFVYVIFLSFINLLLPNFVYGANISNTDIYLQINKDRTLKNYSNLYYNNSLSNSASNIINNMLKYQYFGRVNPKNNTTYYSFINSKLFKNVNIVEVKNYISASNLNSILLKNYSSYIYNNNVNVVGISDKKGTLYGNQNNIAVILFAKGAITPSNIPPIINNIKDNFINYNIIVYTDIAILTLIIFLLILDVFSNYIHYKNYKMASHSHLTFTIITLLVIAIVTVGISL